MRLDQLPSFNKDMVNVIIETPKGSQNKFDYDPKKRVFKLSKTLPLGTAFPFHFGFVPSTIGQDGDPLDILIIMEDMAFPGCYVESRLLGVLEAKQKEKGGKTIRNDRLVGIPNCSIMFQNITDISDLNQGMIKEIENFFIDYNKHEGREFASIGWKKAKKAMELIQKSQKK